MNQEIIQYIMQRMAEWLDNRQMMAEISFESIALRYKPWYYNNDLSDKLLGSPQAGRISRHFLELFHERIEHFH